MESFNRIKDYLLHRLPDKERAQFEAEVRANEALARELELQRFEMETIDQIEADQLREKAVELRQQRQQRLEQNTQGSRSGSMVRMYRIIAAAAVVLLAIGFFFWQKKSVHSEITVFIYKEARVAYNATEAYRGRDADTVFEQAYLKILEDRKQEQASDAIEYFLNFQADSPSVQRRAALNLGHAYLLNQHFLKAAETFEGVQQIPNATTPHQEEAALFRAVALIASGEPNSGQAILEELSKEGKGYDAVAKKLLNRIAESNQKL